MNVTGELYDFSKMHPYSAPLLNPDGSFAYLYDTQDRKPTLNARLANEGYNVLDVMIIIFCMVQHGRWTS